LSNCEANPRARRDWFGKYQERAGWVHLNLPPTDGVFGFSFILKL